jgi:prepilin-type N-terminal cleavage/methylation domain-containing protein
MQRSHVHNQEQGFTLIEILTTVLMMGVIAAMASPSLLGWYRNTQINEAATDVRDALVEAQRQAKRQSKTCSVELGTSISSNDNCLLNIRQLPDEVQIANNLTGGKIEFNFQGDNISEIGTIVLYAQDSSRQKCLVISKPLGIIREGSYTGSTSSIDTNNCQKI